MCSVRLCCTYRTYEHEGQRTWATPYQYKSRAGQGFHTIRARLIKQSVGFAPLAATLLPTSCQQARHAAAASVPAPSGDVVAFGRASLHSSRPRLMLMAAPKLVIQSSIGIMLKNNVRESDEYY
jgi:hypothetical protein